MGIEMITKIRRFIVGKAGISPTVVRSTGTESLAVSQVESEGTDLTRAGRRFMLCSTGTTTGIAPVAAQVTTTTHWAIWNADINKAYVFDHIGVFLNSGTLVAASGILVDICLFTTPALTGANTTGLIVTSCSNGGQTSKAIIKSGTVITTPAAPSWYTVAKSDGNAAYTIFTAAAANYDLRGRIIVPPGQGLGIAVYAAVGAGSPTFVPFAMWAELEMDLE